MRDLFLDALKRKYEAEIAAGKATAKVYFDKQERLIQSGDII